MRKLIPVLVVLWVALIVISIVATRQVEGPRNIDTGFRALNVLFMWQMAAFVVALVALLVAIFGRELGRGMRMLGLAPVALTLLLLGGVIVYSKMASPRLMMPPSGPVTAPVAGDAAQPAPTVEPAETAEPAIAPEAQD